MRPSPWPLAVAAAVLILSVAAGDATAQSASTVPTRVTAFAVDSAVRRLATATLWPGWDPLATPLAVYDGAHTLVFRHSSPGDAYASLSSVQGAWLRTGRDPAVTANSSAMLAGVSTATVMLDSSARSADEWGALALHELFHVYQHVANPRWAANEVALFTYPLEDSVALALRREESFALAEALASEDVEETACWASAFGRVRSARFARFGAAHPDAANYERDTELSEGLARYVENRALGRAPVIRAGEYGADAVRQRAYDVGAALGTLLDRLQPVWRETLDRSARARTASLPALWPDWLLAADVAGRQIDAKVRCSARDEQRARWRAEAARDVDSLAASRVRRRAAFLGASGWTVAIEAGTQWLSPQGFDPLNVSRLTEREILHSRFVKLGRDGTSLQVLGRPTLTEGVAGQHPLFGGVRRITITGLPQAPSVSDSAGVISVRAEGVDGRFPHARVEMGDRELRLTLP